jgi:hypothetical protein
MERKDMKSFVILLCSVIISCACITPCFAQGKVGMFGLGIKNAIADEDNFIILGRYWIADRLTLDGNFGFHYIDRDNENDTKRFLLGIGINQYLLAPKKFNPFVGLDFMVRVDDQEKGTSDTTSEIDGKFGGEYFITDKFSLTGETLAKVRFGDEYEFSTGGRLGVIFYFDLD